MDNGCSFGEEKYLPNLIGLRVEERSYRSAKSWLTSMDNDLETKTGLLMG
jgi:hypothetical protein